MKDILIKYKLIIIPMLIVTIVISLLAYYCSGVVEFNIYKDIIDVRLQKIQTRLIQDDEERQSLTNEIFSDCEEKTRMVAMLISQNADGLMYELSLEEMRVISNAEEVTLCNSIGEIEYSTSTYNIGDTIDSNFIHHSNEKGFTKSITDDNGRIITATTRLDDDGLIQVVFSSESMRKMLKSTDVSTVTSEYPLLKNGFTAIIDTSTYTYLSHTDTSLVGTPSQLPQSNFDFEKDIGGFFCSIGGKKSYVRYSIYNDNILLGTIPTNEIYRLRNSITCWIAFSGLILTCISVLCIRFKKIKDKSNNLTQ